MEFPFVVIDAMTAPQQRRYRDHIDSDRSGWHRRWTESIWRRHQAPSNARLSGWASAADRRRRLIHFYDEYGVEGDGFVLRSAYLWLNLTLPAAAIDGYQGAIRQQLERGRWQPDGDAGGRATWRRGHLTLTVHERALHPEDERRGVSFPATYRNLEIELRGGDGVLPADLAARPWRWFFEVGLRPAQTRGQPIALEPEALAAYLPAQLELGCGPSTEAAIPHLTNLHRIYGVSQPDFSFVFRAEDDAALAFIGDPEAKYREATAIYRACLIAEPTPFYRLVAALQQRGLLVGPVITNNFDCLCADLGLEEISLRRYDAHPYYPMSRGVEFHPAARSLLVVGVHADRRGAQRLARSRGLRVLFIDPERYLAPDGTAIPYPVEAPQDGDGFVRMTAGEAMPRLYRAVVDPRSERAS